MTLPFLLARQGLAIVFGILAGVWVAAALSASLHEGQAHSFDAMLYARALWGLSAGEPVNSVVGVHSFSVHGHFVLWLLAPFVRAFRAVDVLIVAQAASFGVCMTLLIRAVQRAVAVRSPSPVYAAGAAVWTFIVVLCCPLWTNPFVFDVRPETLAAVPAVAGLLRLFERGAGDRWGWALLCATLLVREEFAMLVIAAAVAVPEEAAGTGGVVSHAGTSDEEAVEGTPGVKSRFPVANWLGGWRWRLAAAGIALGWWALYWGVVRGFFGGETAEARVDGAASTLLGNGNWWRSAWRARHWKGELLLAGALAGGGVLAAFPRAWLAALPGWAFVFSMNRMTSAVITFHYAIFSGPALVAGLPSAVRRLAKLQSRRFGAVAIGSLVAAGVLGWTSNTLLPGERYEPLYRDASFAGDASTAHVGPALACIPANAGLIVTYHFAAPFADRRWLARADVMARIAVAEWPGSYTVAALLGRESNGVAQQLIEAGWVRGGERGPVVVWFRDPTEAAAWRHCHDNLSLMR